MANNLTRLVLYPGRLGILCVSSRVTQPQIRTDRILLARPALQRPSYALLHTS